MRSRIFLLFIIFFSVLIAEDSEEKLFSFEDETYHATELSDLLQSIKKSPINIKSASADDLSLLPWLSEIEIKKIINYRKSHNFNDLNKLTKIGISEITINEIKDYVTFGSTLSFKIEQTTRAEFHEAKKEYPSTIKYFQKTLMDINAFRIGFISQKDEGERDPLDFYSYYIDYHSNNFLKHILIGKYRLALGQGILFAPKLGMSKSGAATSTPVKKFNPIKPYTSSYEIWELEGSAANIKLANFSLVPFVSKTSLNANLDSLSQITSFNESGLNLDEEKKNNVTEMMLGIALDYTWLDNTIGLNFLKNEFDHEFRDKLNNNEYSAVSADIIINQNYFPSFGEIAYSEQKIAGVLGTKFGENQLRHLLLFRYYEKGFPTWHGNPFSSQSRFDNEIGLYYGLTITPFVRTKINCYFDVWSFPETRYFEKMPTVGSEQYIQLEKKFDSNSLRFIIQHKDKEKYISLEEAKIRDFERTTYRADWWQFIDDLRFKTRCELVTEYLPDEQIHKAGFLAYEELKYKIDKLSLIGLVAVYHSDVLHYMYEHNVDGIMQNSILKGDGFYSYFMLTYKILANFEIQFKVSDHWDENDKMRIYLQILSNF